MSNYLKHKPGSLEDTINKNLPEDGYQDKFKKELDKAGKGIGAMTPKEKSAFFNKVDNIKKTKDEDAKKVQKQNVDSKKLKEDNDTAFAISGVESERPVENPDLRSELQERGGANTSTRQGSFAKSRKPKYRFGYRVAEKEPEGGKKLKEIRIRPKRAVESDLTKSQVKKVHKKADELPKKSFRDQYGKKKGDSVRYAVATNQTKKKLGIENKNHPAKKKWETLVAKKAKKESDNNTDILPKSQEPTQKTDPMNIQTKEPEKKKTDNGTKSDKIDVNPRIDYHA
jgi:hypothetical protein